MIEIVRATKASAELVNAFARLLPQLSPSAPPLGVAELAEIVESDTSRLLLARDATAGSGASSIAGPGDDPVHGPVLGAVTVVVFRIPSGVRGRVESLVVDDRARGKGVGEALCRAALAAAREMGARTVDLTSTPQREAANRLYRRLGFTLRDTNVYRFAS
jgi:ribosomal protein S18 acetylase RimI-like enzyme